MSLEVMAALMAKIVIMVLIGYILKKSGVISDGVQTGLSALLLKCTLPLSIVAAGNSTFDAHMRTGMLQTAVIAVVYYVISYVGMIALARVLKVGEGRKAVFVTMVVLSNTAFIGYPFIKELYGAEGYMYGVVYNFAYQFALSTVGVRLMSSGERFNWKGFLLSPLTLAPVIAIATFLSPWRMPATLVSVFSEVGNMTTPLSMIIIGGSLASIPLASVWKDKLSYLVSALRLLVIPLATMFVLKAVGITGVVGGTCVLLSAVACGSMNVMFAEQYKQDVAFATRTVIQSMVLMVVTLPFMLLFMERLFA